MTGSDKIGRTVKIGIAVVFSGAAVLVSAGPSISGPGMPALEFTGGQKPVHVILGWHDAQTSHAQSTGSSTDGGGTSTSGSATAMIPPGSTGMNAAGLRLLSGRGGHPTPNPSTTAVRNLITEHRAELKAKLAK